MLVFRGCIVVIRYQPYVMELFMTANVFDCSDVVDEEGIATKIGMVGWMSKARTKTWLF